MERAQLPPGPRFAPLQALLLARDPIAYLERQRARHGDAFTIPVPLFGKIAYFAHPDAVRDVFRGDPAALHAGEANEGPLGPVLGTNSVIVLDDEPHMRERKLLLPPFHGDRMHEYAATFEAAAAEEVARWPVGEPFALRPRMQALSLEVLLRSVLGVTDPGRLAEYHRRVSHMMKVSNAIVWVQALRRDLGRWSPWGRFVRARAEFDELVHEEIDRGRADPALAEREDVLSLLLQARHEDGSPMSREELRDELVSVILAGHETTATGLSWFFERVLRHQHVERRLRDEMAAGEEAYLEATVREVFRVRPPFFDVVRRTTRDVEIGGWTIPARTFIGLSIVLVQRRADVYEAPLEFRPERFLGEAPGGYTWIPFGGGVHRCIGAAFSLLEMKVIAGTILRHARLGVPDGRPERAKAHHVMLAPARGARVVLEERVDPATSVTESQRSRAAA
ncbi:MAG TPA: cytochrome P450 [Thermoleophilaceae bacterium]